MKSKTLTEIIQKQQDIEDIEHRRSEIVEPEQKLSINPKPKLRPKQKLEEIGEEISEIEDLFEQHDVEIG